MCLACAGYSLTLVDSLDMLAVIGDYDEFRRAVKLVIRDVRDAPHCPALPCIYLTTMLMHVLMGRFNAPGLVEACAAA